MYNNNYDVSTGFTIFDYSGHTTTIDVFKSDNSYDEKGNDSKITCLQVYDEEMVAHLLLDLPALEKLQELITIHLNAMKND